MLATPRQAIAELIDMRRRDPSFRGWYPKRMREIRNYLETQTYHGQPVLDVQMSLSNIDALIKEAWHRVQTHDPIKATIEQMAAQGRA